MPSLRTFQQLLPNAKAWRIVVQKTLRDFFTGLVGGFSDARDYIDEVHGDLHPDTTRELAAWESQFGLVPASTATENERRAALAAEWAATGGQSPSYIQGVIQTAGFDVYIHDWWSSGPPYVARDPRDYTEDPLIGDYQCDAITTTQPQCNEFGEDQPQCSAFLTGDPGYIVNRTLVPIAPPPVPDDPDYWPYFVYFGGETFGDYAYVPNARRAEFERLLLKLCPTHLWIVTGLIDFTTEGVFDDSFDSSFE